MTDMNQSLTTVSYERAAKRLNMSKKVFSDYYKDYKLVVGLPPSRDGKRGAVTSFELKVIARARDLLAQQENIQRKKAIQTAIKEAQLELAITAPGDIITTIGTAMLALSRLEAHLRYVPDLSAAQDTVKTPINEMRRSLLDLERLGMQGSDASEPTWEEIRLLRFALGSFSHLTLGITYFADVLQALAAACAGRNDSAHELFSQLVHGIRETQVARLEERIILLREAVFPLTATEAADEGSHLHDHAPQVDPPESPMGPAEQSDLTTEALRDLTLRAPDTGHSESRVGPATLIETAAQVDEQPSEPPATAPGPSEAKQRVHAESWAIVLATPNGTSTRAHAADPEIVTGPDLKLADDPLEQAERVPDPGSSTGLPATKPSSDAFASPQNRVLDAGSAPHAGPDTPELLVAPGTGETAFTANPAGQEDDPALCYRINYVALRNKPLSSLTAVERQALLMDRFFEISMRLSLADYYESSDSSHAPEVVLLLQDDFPDLAAHIKAINDLIPRGMSTDLHIRVSQVSLLRAKAELRRGAEALHALTDKIQCWRARFLRRHAKELPLSPRED